MELYLIQGFFWQKQELTGLSPETENGQLATLVEDDFLRFYFSGIIIKKGQSFSGQMTDHFGKSNLLAVFLSNDTKELSFYKKYEDRNYSIRYEFEKGDHNLWIGTYKKRDKIPTGPAKCPLSKANPTFLQM